MTTRLIIYRVIVNSNANSVEDRIIVNSNANSVEDNNSNDITVSVDCEHEGTICNSLFQTNEEGKYTCELLTRSNQIAIN